MKNKNLQNVEFFNYFDNIYVNNLDYRKDRLEAAQLWFDAFDINPTRLGAVNGQDEFENFFNNLEQSLQPFVEVLGEDIIKKVISDYQKPSIQKKIKNPTENLKGIFGCSISNLFIILHAWKNNYEKVLLLEDDCQPTTALLEYGNSIINEVSKNDWDFISFGKKDKHWKPTNKPNTGGQVQNPPIFRILDGHNHFSVKERGNPTQLHAYAVHSKFYFDYLKVGLGALLGHFDVHVTARIVMHATYPSMFFQSKTYSDIKRKTAWTDIPRDGLLFPETWQYSFNELNFDKFITEASFG